MTALHLLIPGLVLLRRGRPWGAFWVALAFGLLAALALAIGTRDARIERAVTTAQEPPPWSDATIWLAGAARVPQSAASAFPALLAVLMHAGAWATRGRAERRVRALRAAAARRGLSASGRTSRPP